jgi:hypothetical protein
LPEYDVGFSLVQNASVSNKVQTWPDLHTAQMGLLLTVIIILRRTAMDASIERWIRGMQSKVERLDTGDI